jgi:hypothetical protein
MLCCNTLRKASVGIAEGMRRNVLKAPTLETGRLEAAPGIEPGCKDLQSSA